MSELKTAAQLRLEKYEKSHDAEIKYWQEAVQPRIERTNGLVWIEQAKLPCHLCYWKLLEVGQRLGFDIPDTYDGDRRDNSVSIHV